MYRCRQTCREPIRCEPLVFDSRVYSGGSLTNLDCEVRRLSLGKTASVEQGRVSCCVIIELPSPVVVRGIEHKSW